MDNKVASTEQLAHKYMPLFFPIITEGLQKAQEDLGNQDGVYFADLRRYMDPGIKKLFARGILPYLFELAFP